VPGFTELLVVFKPGSAEDQTVIKAGVEVTTGLNRVSLRLSALDKEKPRTPRRGFSGASGSSEGAPDPRTYPFSFMVLLAFLKQASLCLALRKGIGRSLSCSSSLAISLFGEPQSQN
jgi:hypothetical protein